MTKDEGNIGYCNITKCCTEVCPEYIKITDNAIIPLKERARRRQLRPTGGRGAIAGTGRRSSGGEEAGRTAHRHGQGRGGGGRRRRLSRCGRVRAPSPYRFPDAESAFVAWSYAQASLTDARHLAGHRDPGQRPYLTPLWGVWIDDALYLDGAPTTRWARNLTGNPSVAVHVAIQRRDRRRPCG